MSTYTPQSKNNTALVPHSVYGNSPDGTQNVTLYSESLSFTNGTATTTLNINELSFANTLNVTDVNSSISTDNNIHKIFIYLSFFFVKSIFHMNNNP